MKLYELNKGDKFKFNYIGREDTTGIYLGTDGMYAKVHWDVESYDEEIPHSFLAAYLEVEVIFD